MHGSFRLPYPEKRNLSTILEKGGAKLLKREPNPELIPVGEKTYPYHSTPDGPLSKCSHFIIYQEDGHQNMKKRQSLIKYNMSHLKAVPVGWLFTCFDNFALIDLDCFSNDQGQAKPRRGKIVL